MIGVWRLLVDWLKIWREGSARIALVEDDIHVGQLMCLWLEEAGYSSRHYLSGKPFLQDMARETFDLVILD